LQSRCLRCHQGTNPPSGVRLDRRSAWLGEGDGRPLAVPGHGASSRAVRAVAGLSDKAMPPRGRRLTPAEVGLLRAWGDPGRPWAAPLRPPAPPPAHGAFRPLSRPAVPAAAGAANPIDAFLAARQRALGVVPLPEAPRRTLIRRLSLDLLGLPPAPEEVDAFT